MKEIETIDVEEIRVKKILKDGRREIHMDSVEVLLLSREIFGNKLHSEKLVILLWHIAWQDYVEIIPICSLGM